MKKNLFTFLCASVSTALVAQTNLNLETWTGNEPDGWLTFNITQQLGAQQSTFKETTDPGEGTASAKMQTVYCSLCPSFGAPDTIPGIVGLSADGANLVQGIPYTQKPVSLSFVYKANPLAGDAGAVLIQVSHWDNNLQQQVIDGQGIFVVDTVTNIWTSETITLNYFTADTPDTLFVAAGSSAAALFSDPQFGSSKIGSEFWADNFVITLPPDPCANSTLAITVTGTNQSVFGVNDGSATAVASGYAGEVKTVQVSSNQFTPGSFNAAVGDTVEWVWVSGSHTTTSTSVPNGAAAWDSPMTSSNQSFKYPITLDGNYQYKCTPHESMGMIGNFTASTPYSFLWSNAETTDTISGLAPGTYTVTVSDPNGCTVSGSYTVAAAPDPCANSTIAVAVTGTNETVLGANDGTATASASGGTSPYALLWSNSDTTATISGLAPAIYTVTVTDADGCTTSGSYTVAAGADPCANASVAVAVTGTNETAAGANDGTATATVTSGYSGEIKTVQVSSNQFTPNAFNAMAGDTVEWVWVSGSHTTTSVSVPTGAAGWDSPMTSSNQSFKYPVTVAGNYGYKCTPHALMGMVGGFDAKNPYSLSWSNADTTETISGLAPATYTVTVTDFDGCTASGSYTVLAAPGGINSLELHTAISVFPNPAKNSISFSMKGKNAGRILIYSLTGKTMESVRISNNLTVSLENFSEGIYFYQLQNNNSEILQSGKFSVIK